MSGVEVLPDTDRQSYGPQGRSSWLDVDWAEHQRWVTIAERPVNVIELGDGPPIVFVHGLSGSWPEAAPSPTQRIWSHRPLHHRLRLGR